MSSRPFIAPPTRTVPQIGGTNPILDEIDSAHANLSPPAKQALETAHGNLMSQVPQIAPPPATPTPQLTAPQPTAGMTARRGEMERLEGSPSGIGQIKNPWARVPLQILDAVGGGIVPGIEQRIPGTQGHHEVILGQARANVGEDETALNNQGKRQLESAQATEQASLPGMHAAQAENQTLRLTNEQQRHEAEDEIKREQEGGRNDRAEAQRGASLHEHGFKLDASGQVVPLDYGEMSEQQQAIHDLKASQGELADANAALAKAKKENQPKLMEMAQARIQTAQGNASTAAGRLGLSQAEYNANYLGTDASGKNAIPGAPADEDGNPMGIRTANATKPTGVQRDAAGRATTALELDSRIRTALQNPEILKGTGPLAGRLSEIEGRVGVLPHDLAQLKQDLISYGAFQAGQHPVRGIGAMQYFEKAMGGLGQTPQELLGKLDSNAATSKSVQNIGNVHRVAPQGGNQLPGGITIDEINAELDRRKKAKK